ncbi:MAG: potassium transporter TrkG [Victivallales bacterium]|nr:potassium transporter TrkG [Victivallales bacterium]
MGHILRKSQLYFILSFVGLIILGAWLLYLSTLLHGKPLTPINSLFIATSAVCVTGLTPVSISGFGLGGQIILLVLIQTGGLGIMTLTSSLFLMVRRDMNLDNKLLISGFMESYSGRELPPLLYLIPLYTVIIELIGAALLTFCFWTGSMHLPFHEALYQGIFHSVSAFCNAGFSTFDDSLMRAGPVVKLIVAGLIVCGGLGFYVIFDLWLVFRKKTFMKLYSKLVLIVTVILIVGGTLLLKAAENVEGTPLSWLDALFQSVTARTAGFNTVDIAGLHTSGILLLIALMMIGASPGSTGGGMKTTTLAIVAVAIYKTFIGERQITMFRRQIPMPNVLKAFSIMVLFIVLSVVAVLLIDIYEDEPLYSMLFEAVSALGTVGLSLGLTAKAAFGTKIVLICCMFLGRIGPFTFFIFLLSREKNTKLQYPEERIIMG